MVDVYFADLRLGANEATGRRTHHRDQFDFRYQDRNPRRLGLCRIQGRRGEVLNSVFRGARRTLLVRTQAGELRIEVPALTCPKVGETIEIGAAKSALWAFECS
jgi:hypothetical protein